MKTKNTKEKAKDHRNRLAEIEQKICEYDILCNIDPSVKNLNDLDAVKHKYELLFDYIVCGHIRWNEFKILLKLEKNRSGKTAVRQLFDSKGSITVNPQTR